MLVLAVAWCALGACALGACALAGRSDRIAESFAATESITEEWMQETAA